MYTGGEEQYFPLRGVATPKKIFFILVMPRGNSLNFVWEQFVLEKGECVVGGKPSQLLGCPPPPFSGGSSMCVCVCVCVCVCAQPNSSGVLGRFMSFFPGGGVGRAGRGAQSGG